MEQQHQEEIKGYTTDLETGEIIKTEDALIKFAKPIAEQQFRNQISLQNASLIDYENAITENTKLQILIPKLLQKDVHYGKIEGISKLVLYQSGADLLAKTCGISIDHKLIDKETNYDIGYMSFIYKATATWQGMFLQNADAECNSLETKWRKQFQDNENGQWVNKKYKSVYDVKNTIIQMAQKRASNRVVRKVLGITGIFTQDIEKVQVQRDEIKRKVNIVYNHVKTLYNDKIPPKHKNDITEMQIWLHKKVIKPICEKLKIVSNYKLWNEDDCEAIMNILNTENLL